MAYEIKKNTGTLFKNENRNVEKNHPHTSGNVKIECPHCRQEQEYKMAGWMMQKEGKKPYYFLTFKTPEDQTRQEMPAKENESLPF